MTTEEPTGERFGGGDRSTPAVYPIAVIEIGTTAVRMAIAETDGSTVRFLEQLTRGVSLGKDTFTVRAIQRDSAEQCIDALRSYRRKLEEYQCSNPNHIRVVATSAVREASNRLEFLDRVYMATGFAVEPIDEAEIARLNYLSIRPLLQREEELTEALTVLMEVGGGTTEVQILRGRNVVHSQSCRLGSLRLQQMLRQYQTSSRRVGSLLTGQIDRTLEQIRDRLPAGVPVRLLALGGDIRFACRTLRYELHSGEIQRLPLDDLQELTRELLKLSADQMVGRYHMDLAQAESLSTALLTYVRAGALFHCPELLVSDYNLRDALLRGMVQSPAWTTDLQDQILHSVTQLARRFQTDLTFAQHVAELAVQIFRALQPEHNLPPSYETILQAAAILHEVGLFISTRAYHKHSYYLITHSEIFGLNSRDQALVAQVARYHRRAAPKPSHEAFARLDRDSRVNVSRLSAILRVARALDHSRTQRIPRIEAEVHKRRLVLTADAAAGDLSLERMELRQQSRLFEDTFGRRLLLREGRRK